jgi:hypothetical protein
MSIHSSYQVDLIVCGLRKPRQKFPRTKKASVIIGEFTYRGFGDFLSVSGIDNGLNQSLHTTHLTHGHLKTKWNRISKYLVYPARIGLLSPFTCAV